MMNILLDIAHPSQAHLFHAFTALAAEHGHRIQILGRAKDCTNELLDAWGMSPADSTVPQSGIVGSIAEMLLRNIKLLRLARRSRAQVILGTPPSVAHVARLCRIPGFLVNEDDVDVVPQLAWAAYSFATGVIAPAEVRMGRWHHRHRPYRGCQKLAYLHPNRFVPDPAVPRSLGFDPDVEPFAMLRLTAFRAYHDRGQCGLDAEQLRRLVEVLRRRYRICISAEGELPAEFAGLRLVHEPRLGHHIQAAAALFVGDSQSMTTESGLLGVPSFRCNSFAGRSSVMERMERDYGLMRSFVPERFNEMLAEIDALPSDAMVSREIWRARRDRYVADSVDVAAWMVGFVERAVAGQDQ